MPAAAAVRARFCAFELDEARGCLLRDGRLVTVPPTPFAVLCELVRQPGVLLTKNALLDQVWGHQFVSDSVLKTVISELRALLDDDARQPRCIETVSRRGYRFIAAVNSVPGGAPAWACGKRLLPAATLHRAGRRALAAAARLGWRVRRPVQGGVGRR